jgi:hypothetical protein
MCPQAPRLSPEYSHKAGLQTVITGKPLQIRPVMRSGHAGPVTMGRITRGLCVGRDRGMGRPRHRPSSCDACDEGWSLPVVLSPLVQRDWRRHRAKGGVFAFAPTKASRRISRSSRTSTSSRIRLATSSGQLPVVGLFTLAKFRFCVL